MKGRLKISSDKCFIIFSCFLALMLSSCAPGGQIPLEKPRNLRVENITHDSAVLVWSPVPNCTGYKIDISGGYGVQGMFLWTYEPRCVVSNLEWEETYLAEVNAEASGTVWDMYVDGGVSKIYFTTTMPGVPEGEMERPYHLQAVLDEDDNTIELTWDAVEGAALYDVKCEHYKVQGYHDIPLREETRTVDTNSFNDYFTDRDSKVVYTVCARNLGLSNENNWSKPLRVKIRD